jgi:hypothetical protein
MSTLLKHLRGAFVIACGALVLITDAGPLATPVLPKLRTAPLRASPNSRISPERFCQGSRHRLWPTRVRLGIGPPLTKGAGEDAVLGMRVGGGDRAAGAHRPGLWPLPLPCMWQAVQRAPST